MPTKLRIATFNLENLDDNPGERPSLAERSAIMQSQLIRIDADILCLQEVHGQETEGQPRALLALDKLLASTKYATYQRASTLVENGSQVYDVRNLVVLSRFAITARQQYKHDFAPAPFYQKVTAQPPESAAKEVTWERPILHTQINLLGRVLHVINVHLKSRLPSPVTGQQSDRYTWSSASGWAEGSFISTMKRVGQALETRMLIDKIFDEDEDALIAVCGDFNANYDEVSIEAIRGEVENTNNEKLIKRVLVPCERSIPESARYSLLHQGRGAMLDHLIVSRGLLAFYRGSEIHNELLHDESVGFASDRKFPESDHAPVIAEFELPD